MQKSTTLASSFSTRCLLIPCWLHWEICSTTVSSVTPCCRSIVLSPIHFLLCQISAVLWKSSPRCDNFGTPSSFICLVISRNVPVAAHPYACHLLLHASWTTQSNYYPRYPKHIKEFEARDASRRVALNLPNVSYPIYPASVYQPYSFYLPDSYRIDQFYSANWNRYPGGIYSSGGMADGDKSHNNKWAPWIFCCWEDLLFFRYIFISNGAVERVVKEKDWNMQNQVMARSLMWSLC